MSYYSARLDADPRKFPRYYVNRRSRLIGPAGEIDVWTVDISGGGARLGLDVMSSPSFDGPGWTLLVPGLGLYGVTRLWSKGSTFGVLFDLALPEQEKLNHTLGQRFAKVV